MRKGSAHDLAYWSTALFGLVKQAQSEVTWLSNYSHNYEGLKMSHTDAVQMADKAVRDTQGSGTIVNLPALLAPGTGWQAEAAKLATMFQTFENSTSNRMWTIGRQLQRGVETFRDSGWAGAKRDFEKAFGSSLFYLVGPVVLVTGIIMANRAAQEGKMGPAIEEVAKDPVKALGKVWEAARMDLLDSTLRALMGGATPFSGEIIDGVKMGMGAHADLDNPFSGALKAWGSTMKNALDYATQHQVHDKRWVSHAAESVGYVFGFPTKPFARAGDYWWDRKTGRVAAPGWGEDVLHTVTGPAPGVKLPHYYIPHSKK
jgi:hypothetical protein